MNRDTPIKDAIFRVIDTETTGLDPSKDRIVEIGACDVWRDRAGTLKVQTPNSWLCDPGIKIPPTASAVHHITDRMVQGLAPAARHIQLLVTGAGPKVVMCAHNAEFDRAFVRDNEPWLCTMRLAKHLFRDAPGHKNEELRYFLGYEKLEVWDDVLNRPAPTHRAVHDAYVTAIILKHMIDLVEPLLTDAATIGTLIDFAEAPVVLTGVVGFGKHHDVKWSDVDRGYLQWMVGENEKSLRQKGEPAWDRDRMHTVNYYLAK